MSASRVPGAVLSDALVEAIAGRRVRSVVFTTFSFDPAFFEQCAQRTRYRVAKTQIILHLVTTQIEIAITKPHFLTRMLLVMERRCLRLVEDREFAREEFDLAGRHLRIDRSFGALTQTAVNRQHVLAADALGFGKDLGRIGIEYDLEQAFTVAQVDEDYPAVVTSPVDPARDRNFFSDQRTVDLAAVMTAHGL